VGPISNMALFQRRNANKETQTPIYIIDPIAFELNVMVSVIEISYK